MAKTGYRFNPETLSYDKIHTTIGKRIISLSIKFFQSLSLALVLYFAISSVIESPKEKALRREKDEILAQYNLLNTEIDRLDGILTGLEKRDDNIYRVIFEADPIDASIRNGGTGGNNKYEALRNMDNAELIINTSKKLDALSKAMYIQSRSYDEVEYLVRNKMDMLASIPAIPPVALNNKSIRFASSYGNRIHPIYKTVKLHAGMDFSGPIGTPIYATGNGKVHSAKNRSGYGKCVEIDHGFNYHTLYAHLDQYNVRPGQKVKRGDIIGYLGNTGQSTGPHIHYEVRRNGRPVDPINYYFNDLSAEEYERLVEAANNNGQTMD